MVRRAGGRAGVSPRRTAARRPLRLGAALLLLMGPSFFCLALLLPVVGAQTMTSYTRTATFTNITVIDEVSVNLEAGCYLIEGIGGGGGGRQHKQY